MCMPWGCRGRELFVRDKVCSDMDSACISQLYGCKVGTNILYAYALVHCGGQYNIYTLGGSMGGLHIPYRLYGNCYIVVCGISYVCAGGCGGVHNAYYVRCREGADGIRIYNQYNMAVRNSVLCDNAMCQYSIEYITHREGWENKTDKDCTYGSFHCGCFHNNLYTVENIFYSYVIKNSYL